MFCKYSTNLLTVAGKTNYYEPMVLPDPYKSAKVVPQRPGQIVTGNKTWFKLFPNPAYDYFIVEYEMEQPVFEAFFKVTDVLGREIKKISVSKQYNQLVINTTSLKEGVYFVVFEVNGDMRYTAKLTVAK